jgi:hypothetical protein
LLIEKHWEEMMNPPVPASEPAKPAQTNEKLIKHRESKPAAIELAQTTGPEEAATVGVCELSSVNSDATYFNFVFGQL